jgi:hypothetical protein
MSAFGPLLGEKRTWVGQSLNEFTPRVFGLLYPGFQLDDLEELSSPLGLYQ